MSKRYEYYNTSDNASLNAYQNYWYVQTFTPVVSHRLTGVKLLLYRIGIPTTTTIHIRATDPATKEPIGDDLTSASFDGSTLTDDPAGEWKEITLPRYSLKKDVRYALILSELANIEVGVAWRRDDGIGGTGYSRGARGSSSDGGVTWAVGLDGDGGFMFEEWGDPLYAWKGNILIDQLIYQHAERMVR